MKLFNFNEHCDIGVALTIWMEEEKEELGGGISYSRSWNGLWWNGLSHYLTFPKFLMNCWNADLVVKAKGRRESAKCSR